MTYEIWKTPNIECTRESGRIQQWITISFRNGYNLAQLGAETASAMCVAGETEAVASLVAIEAKMVETRQCPHCDTPGVFSWGAKSWHT